MTDLGLPRLPRVIVSSVIRASNKGESHGGVYLVDLETEMIRQCLDWDDFTIDWAGRGADRGLRGMAFHDGQLYLASSDQLLVYDQDFRLQETFENRYLKHCHEIHVADDSLFMAAPGFDSVLTFDLRTRTFAAGSCLRYGWLPRARSSKRLNRLRRNLRANPSLRTFDPLGEHGPEPKDTCHINNVFSERGIVYASGTRLGSLMSIRNGRMKRFARIPFGTHNARPFAGGVLLNDTQRDRVALLTRRGKVLQSFMVPRYSPDLLENADRPDAVARQAFARGLAVVGDGFIVGGSSPATVTVYQLNPLTLVKAINLTMDVRNSIHGLEIWPFD